MRSFSHGKYVRLYVLVIYRVPVTHRDTSLNPLQTVRGSDSMLWIQNDKPGIVIAIETGTISFEYKVLTEGL